MKNQTKKLTNGDIILLLLYANNCSPIIGRTRFQKILFVFEKEIYIQHKFDKKIHTSTPSLFSFSAYNYGPFSLESYKLLEFFINIGMVTKKNNEAPQESISNDIHDYEIINSDLDKNENADYDITMPPKYIDEQYLLSEKGKEYVETYLSRFYIEKKEILDTFKNKFVNSSLKAILQYVYTKYPDMTANSKIRDEVLK